MPAAADAGLEDVYFSTLYRHRLEAAALRKAA